ncbi:MAG TPA: (5-formylfuran-3-yl)methyl phosphate synthase [Acetobacteraceae bacterium]|nr:(5-formylfuran-3-yl)methyl phosphate synthase [Acetobacteraceae bacterium]
MTRMLASVTGPEEAELALASGADVIDLKDPAGGAFAAVSLETVRATVRAVAGRRPVSAVAGELPMRAQTVVAAVGALAECGVDFVKLGILAGDPLPVIAALAPLAARVRLIAVLFADRVPDFGLLPMLAQARFAGAMLDTAAKDGARLLDHMPLPRLRAFVEACRSERLMAGLAGALEAPDVPRLLLLGPDVLGFRGALTGPGGRAAPIAREAVQAIRALIPPEGQREEGGAVDYRLLAARGYAPDPNGDPSVTDRVFVRDLVLPVRIGAYARERAAPQRVRFTIDVLVWRATHASFDMRDVFSYDVITDGIRLLVDAGHLPLVETLAERIAEMLLTHPRVVRAIVTVEKLDTGSGTVGVSIERTRASVSTAAGAVGRS